MLHRILIIEDTPIVREPMVRLLRGEGFAVTGASNGVEAMASLSASAADLVLLDVLMPKMNGVAFLEKFRADSRWANVPVIAVTGVLDSACLGRLRELGVRAVINKGRFDFESMLGEIHKVLPVAA